ncbi:amiloride-sensitive sodium channel subunit alpha-like [Symsagittifera roscoffensis]|uniref:amiloride-sensitive sodium channel subunit alpha-like n=1 Tax=Symsagittifera roscoffensis TaxID=84072 RepID=UPI00307C04AC
MDRRSRRASSNGGCNGAAVAPTSEHKSCHSNGCPQGHETDSHETPHDSIRVGPNNQSDNMGVSPSTARACCHELSAPSPKHIEPQLTKTENSTLKNTLLFIIVCISLGMLLYTSVKVISEYLDEPIAVETTLKKEHDPRKKFPEIIVCSHRMASMEKIKANLDITLGVKDMAEVFLEKVKNGEEVPEDFFDQRGVNIDDVYNNILWHSTNLSYLPSEKLEAIKISRDEFVIDCQIKNYTFPPNYINCLANMEDITTNEYAVCQKIKLTVDQADTATKFTGSTYGLRLNLFLNTKDTSGEISSASGVRVTISDPEYPVIPQNSGVDVAPGIALSMGFRRFEYLKINRKSREFECISHLDWTPFLSPNSTVKGLEYASTDHMLCDQTCSSIYTQQKCNCSTMHFFGDTICQKSEPCVIAEPTYSWLKRRIKHCRETMCKTSCRKVDYRVTTNQAMFPSEAFMPVFIGRILSDESKVSDYIKRNVRQLVSDSGGVNNVSLDLIRREFVHLHIYQESSDTTIIEEKNIYTEWSLLSNIGGNMGMFLGLSIVGFFKVAIRLKNRVALALKKTCMANRGNEKKVLDSIVLKSSTREHVDS